MARLVKGDQPAALVSAGGVPPRLCPGARTHKRRRAFMGRAPHVCGRRRASTSAPRGTRAHIRELTRCMLLQLFYSQVNPNPMPAAAARAARLVEAQLVEGELLDRTAIAGRRAGAQDRRAQLADDAAVPPQLRAQRTLRARARGPRAPLCRAHKPARLSMCAREQPPAGGAHIAWRRTFVLRISATWAQLQRRPRGHLGGHQHADAVAVERGEDAPERRQRGVHSLAQRRARAHDARRAAAAAQALRGGRAWSRAGQARGAHRKQRGACVRQTHWRAPRCMSTYQPRPSASNT